MRSATMKPETRIEMARGMLAVLSAGGTLTRADLGKRFPRLKMTFVGAFNPERNSYDVTVEVTPEGYDGEPISVTEDVWDFPSDTTLAQLALLNG
jgi:hypothetical protein